MKTVWPHPWIAAHPWAAFVAKMLGVYALWFVLYDLWLGPDGRLDAVVSVSVARLSEGLLLGMGYAAQSYERILWIEGTPGIEVVAGCNGLAIIGLFVGFVVAYPGTARRRLGFLAFGTVVLYLANLGRITLLALCQLYRPAAFDVVHRLGAKPMFYTLVFVMWLLWMHFGTPRTSAAQMGAMQGRVSV